MARSLRRPSGWYWGGASSHRTRERARDGRLKGLQSDVADVDLAQHPRDPPQHLELRRKHQSPAGHQPGLQLRQAGQRRDVKVRLEHNAPLFGTSLESPAHIQTNRPAPCFRGRRSAAAGASTWTGKGRSTGKMGFEPTSFRVIDATVSGRESVPRRHGGFLRAPC